MPVLAANPDLFQPTPDQVQSVLVAREIFTTDSSPTYKQVEQRCEDLAAELAGEIQFLPVNLYGLASSVVIYKVAADVEAGSWPEQQAGNASSGGIWYLRYVEAHTRLINILNGLGDGTGNAQSVQTVSATVAAAQWLEGVAPSLTPDVIGNGPAFDDSGC